MISSVYNIGGSSLSKKQIISLFLLGFSSGLPLLLTASTLAMRLKQAYGISYHLISMMSLAAMPYALKFIWSPLIDGFKIPYLSDRLGLRRSWLLLSQVCLIVCLQILSVLSVGESLLFTSVIIIFISFFSATQETSFLAYQADNIEKQKYGISEAVNIFGYRVGMLLASAGVLYLVEFIDWKFAYSVVSFGIVFGILTTLFIIDERNDHNYNNSKEIAKQENIYGVVDVNNKNNKAIYLYLKEKILQPFREFADIPGWYIVLLLMFSYKMGDHLIGNMSNIYYLELGFGNIEIANASKIFGMLASIVGGFVGSFVIRKVEFDQLRSLAICLVLHAISSVMYIYLYYAGNDINVLYLSVALENITSGMRTIALLSFQLYLCNGKSSATKMAIMTSAIHLSRVILSSTSGLWIELFGWRNFFVIVVLSYLPALFLILILKKKITSVYCGSLLIK